MLICADVCTVEFPAPFRQHSAWSWPILAPRQSRHFRTTVCLVTARTGTTELVRAVVRWAPCTVIRAYDGNSGQPAGPMERRWVQDRLRAGGRRCAEPVWQPPAWRLAARCCNSAVRWGIEVQKCMQPLWNWQNTVMGPAYVHRLTRPTFNPASNTLNTDRLSPNYHSDRNFGKELSGPEFDPDSGPVRPILS